MLLNFLTFYAFFCICDRNAKHIKLLVELRETMASKSQKAWLRRNVGTFLQQYTRKAQRGVEPNDRHYCRDLEKELKQLRPEELNEVLYGDEELPSLKPKKNQPDIK